MEPDEVAAPVADARANPDATQQPSRGLSAEPQQASPEEQELYNRFVSKAFLLVYDEKFLPKAVDMLAGEGDPMEGLARVTVLVVMRILKAAQQGGQELGGDVLFHGAKEVFEDLAELSRQAGVFDYSQDPDKLEGAYFRALDQFRMAQQGEGTLDKESAQSDLAMLQQMEESGELEGMFRDLASRDAAAVGEVQTDEEAAPAPPQRGGLMPQEMK